jgi:hypothetical protein
MIKNTVIALVATAALAGAASPAFADVFGDSSTTEMREFTANSILAELQQKGINATSVEDWSGLVRAYVTLEDGTQTMQLFTPGSLEQVTL